MLFSHNGKPCIFIHTPKTGGNTIQKELIDRGLSLDQMRVNSRQDGEDRFEIRSKYTKRKHMSLNEYWANERLRRLDVYVVLRNPIHRMISLYLSPHRHLLEQKDGRSFFKQPEIDHDLLRQVVNNALSTTQMISVTTTIGEMIPTKIRFLRFENFDAEVREKLGFTPVRARNVSPFHVHREELRADPSAIKIIKDSHHGKDLELFYGM